MTPLENPAQKRRVVVIDDDLIFAEFLSKMVGTFGHDVVVKMDPTASHTYEIRDSDIVFLDLMMPQLSGLRVLEQLARQNSKCEIAIKSGNGEVLDQGEKLMKKWNLNMAGVLEKPFRVSDVVEILEAT